MTAVIEAKDLCKTYVVDKRQINVLKNCMDDPNQLAATLAERTKSEVVQVIGRKIVLFRQNQEKSKIEFPRNTR